MSATIVGEMRSTFGMDARSSIRRVCKLRSRSSNAMPPLICVPPVARNSKSCFSRIVKMKITWVRSDCWSFCVELANIACRADGAFVVSFAINAADSWGNEKAITFLAFRGVRHREEPTESRSTRRRRSRFLQEHLRASGRIVKPRRWTSTRDRRR